MGPNFWRHPTTGLKKCSERTSNSCDPTETDGCCAVIPCTYCLRWEPYLAAEQYGTAEFDIDGWRGTIAGVLFVGYWERNQYTGECEFVVTLNGDEIYRKSCYEGQSCRDSSDSALATIGYDDGTLYWDRLEPHPLPHVTDPDTGCRTWFCGDCECTCRCLCVTIEHVSNDILVPSYMCLGEICNTSYDCDAPVWSGTVVCEYDTYDISLGLSRDPYTGGCLISGTVNGTEVDAVLISGGCQTWTASFALDSYTTLTVQCKRCECEQNTVSVPCCETPVPRVLYATYESIGGTCDNLHGTVVRIEATVGGGDNCWEGEKTVGSCGGGGPGVVSIAMSCYTDEFGVPKWRLVDAPGGCGLITELSAEGTVVSCDPFEVVFHLGPGVGCCEPVAVDAEVNIRVTE